MVLFKDIAKSSSDLITKDFPHANPLDVEVKSVSSPITLTATGTLNGKGQDASIQAAYALGSVRASGKVSATASTLDATVAVPKGYKLEGLSFQSKYDLKKDKSSLELATEFFANRCHTRLAVNPFDNSFAASSLFGTFSECDAKVGASLSGTLEGKDLKYSVGTIFAARGVAFSVRTADAAFGLPTGAVATAQFKKGDIDFAVEAKIKSDLKADVNFAVARQLDADTGIKFRFLEGKGAFALSHKMSKLATVSFGVESDAKDGLKVGSKLFFAQ